MPSLRRLAAVTATLVLVLGSSARAQSAGDNQYVDPFGKQPSSKSHSTQGQGGQGNQGAGGQGQSQSPSSPPPPSTSTGTPSTTTSAAPATGTAAGTAASGQGQLARTGLAPGWLGLAGGALLLGGVGLRRRTGV
jgi:hypothetical protein